MAKPPAVRPGSLSLHQQDVKSQNPEWSAKSGLKEGVAEQFNSTWYGVKSVVFSGGILTGFVRLGEIQAGVYLLYLKLLLLSVMDQQFYFIM